MPQCGFSAAVVGVLKETGVPFESHNILADPELREGLKEYSSWPTYPQLYVDGKLVGGADIVRDLHAKGELKQILARAARLAGASREAPAGRGGGGERRPRANRSPTAATTIASAARSVPRSDDGGGQIWTADQGQRDGEARRERPPAA